MTELDRFLDDLLARRIPDDELRHRVRLVQGSRSAEAEKIVAAARLYRFACENWGINAIERCQAELFALVGEVVAIDDPSSVAATAEGGG